MKVQTRCCGSPLDGVPGAVAQPDRPRKRVWTRLCEGAAWVVSGGLLLLVPKCPMCVAAYIAAGTGLGLSYSSAAYLRTGLIWVCVGSLVWLVVRRVRRRGGGAAFDWGRRQ